jgi:RNA polymerase sigma factor (sigma-70 family)
MAAQESAAGATAAIKAAFDELLRQIGRHKELLRNSHNWRRRRSAEGRPVPEIPFEQSIAAVPMQSATPDDIRSYVNGNLRRLQAFVERELFFRESSGELPPDAVTAEEVVDEVVARALDERVDKPDRLAVEPWLYRLAIHAMDDAASRLAEADSEVNLQGLRQRRNERASDEPRLQFHQPDEAMTTESGIRDDRLATPEEIAYTDEMLALVQLALNGTRPEDREAFILHALEGFFVDEIAAITDRKPEQVQQSIARAREKLRHRLSPNNPLKKKLLQPTGTR